MQWKWWSVTALLLAGILFAACSEPTRPAIDNESVAQTQQALVEQALQATQTIAAMQGQLAQMQTVIARATGAAMLTRAVPPTRVPPSETPQVPDTGAPTGTPTPAPTADILPTPTITVLPCNAAVVVEDVTIPPGTVLPPGVFFTKIWRVRNVGACSWTGSYSLVFAGGERLIGPEAVGLPGTVGPGQVIDLAVDLVAPAAEGTYRGFWRLRDPAGIPFGDPQSSDALLNEVRVQASNANYPLDFVAYSCLAQWSSGADRLPCQGDPAESRGSVRRLEMPILENGYQDDEPALLLQPQMITDGIVRGRYPPVRVEQGYVFSSVIGCARGAEACNVNFVLSYQIGSGPIVALATWNEVYDEQYQLAEVDLSSLAGNDVRFILTVQSNGSAHQDRGLWLAPRIIRR